MQKFDKELIIDNEPEWWPRVMLAQGKIKNTGFLDHVRYIKNLKI